MTTIGLIALGILVWHYRELLPFIVIIACILLVLRQVLKTEKTKRHYRFVNTTVYPDANTIKGLNFEKHVATILKNNGYTKVRLTERYDYGVDIIALKGGTRFGVQVKCYTGLVGADAVRQVVTGLAHYQCEQAMVITNSDYTTVAKTLAKSNECILIDGKQLRKLEREDVRRGYFQSLRNLFIHID